MSLAILAGVWWLPSMFPNSNGEGETQQDQDDGLDPAAESLFRGDKTGQEWDGNGPRMKFCWCPPGKFKMGEGDGAVDVTLTSGFWMGKTEVTQAQWIAVMPARPKDWKRLTKAGDDYPATFVTWDDAARFCEQLTNIERAAGKLPAGWEYRLPTEAEWEYACRSGTQTWYSFGNDASRLGDNAWYSKNSHDVGERYAHLVGRKRPSPWGFHDMHGNVWEWCLDGYQDKLPGGTNPEITKMDAFRLYRGGGFDGPASNCRSAARRGSSADYAVNSLGFRVAAVQAER